MTIKWCHYHASSYSGDWERCDYADAENRPQDECEPTTAQLEVKP